MFIPKYVARKYQHNKKYFQISTRIKIYTLNVRLIKYNNKAVHTYLIMKSQIIIYHFLKEL